MVEQEAFADAGSLWPSSSWLIYVLEYHPSPEPSAVGRCVDLPARLLVQVALPVVHGSRAGVGRMRCLQASMLSRETFALLASTCPLGRFRYNRDQGKHAMMRISAAQAKSFPAFGQDFTRAGLVLV